MKAIVKQIALPRKGRTAGMNARFLASTNTPSKPVIRMPRRFASVLPRRSSMSNKSALISSAKAIASDSPGSRLYFAIAQPLRDRSFDQLS
ncbi:hypothetical protein [Coleofasciculus sp. E2-BRE-01]|uniref:hypothetical protein n=1 Tax=unclassified Coleofasciculus TaxID=2692782 RepID=UPI0032F709C8